MTNPVQWPIPFGNYLLDGPIAHGGMARLFRARLRGVSGFEKPLAVKQMRPDLAQDPRFVKLFVEEARALVRLGHPHIVTVYELGIVEGTYFLAMEHVEGASLAEILRDGPLSPEIVAHVGAQAADALAHAHGRHGLVHRDMTPRNVLVDRSGYVRVVDFGIAGYEGSGNTLGLGSPGYMAPEQIRGEKTGTESDIFGLAATLYYAATGSHAYYEEDLARVRERVLAGELPDTSMLPGPLATLLETCFAAEPSKRPTAAALASALRGYVAGISPEGVSEKLAARVEHAWAKTVDDAPSSAPTSIPVATEREFTVRTLATNTALEDALVVPPTTQPMTLDDDAPERESVAPRMRRRVIALGFATLATVGVVGLFAERAVAPERPTGRPREVRTIVVDASVADAAVSVAAPVPAPADAAVADAGAELASRDAGLAPRPVQQGSLTVAATPWADVRVDGRSLGRTPKRGIALPAGAHTVELSCPPLGRNARTRIRVEPGRETRVVGDLSVNPPSVRVR